MTEQSTGYTRLNEIGKREQLCWSCSKANCGCSWSREFRPVPGWDSDAYIRKPEGRMNPYISWRVYHCPEFVDGRKAEVEVPKPQKLGKRLSRYQIRHLIRLVDANCTYLEITRETGFSAKTIVKYRRKRDRGELKWLEK